MYKYSYQYNSLQYVVTCSIFGSSRFLVIRMDEQCFSHTAAGTMQMITGTSRIAYFYI